MRTCAGRPCACDARRSCCPTLACAASSTTSTAAVCARSRSSGISDSGGNRLLGGDRRADMREAHRSILEPAELEVDDVERVVLVQAPRRLRSLFGELV